MKSSKIYGDKRFEFGRLQSHYEYTRDSAEAIEMREKYLFGVDMYHSEGYEIFVKMKRG